MPQTITIYPAIQERWDDFAALMGPKGGVGGCWCMLWRQSRKQDDINKGDRNRALMKEVFEQDVPPGLLAYDGDASVAWLSVAPRSAFVRLEASRILKPVDDRAVWSVSCFLIQRSHRRMGLAVALLRAARTFVGENGGTVLEGYPVDPAKDPYPAAYAWTGMAESFRRAGFVEVARRSETRPIMRAEAGDGR